MARRVVVWLLPLVVGLRGLYDAPDALAGVRGDDGLESGRGNEQFFAQIILK